VRALEKWSSLLFFSLFQVPVIVLHVPHEELSGRACEKVCQIVFPLLFFFLKIIPPALI
jgi:hypothetical protein